MLKDYRKKRPDTITFEIYTTFQQLVQLAENAQKEYVSIVRFVDITANILLLMIYMHGLFYVAVFT